MHYRIVGYTDWYDTLHDAVRFILDMAECNGLSDEETDELLDDIYEEFD